MPISSHPNRIHLKNLDVQMHIGVFDEEFARKQRVLVSMDVAIDPPSMESDDIALTLDYNLLRDVVIDFANGKGFRTIEAFVAAILEFLKDQPLVVGAYVLVKKPDIFPDCDYIGFSGFWER